MSLKNVKELVGIVAEACDVVDRAKAIKGELSGLDRQKATLVDECAALQDRLVAAKNEAVTQSAKYHTEYLEKVRDLDRRHAEHKAELDGELQAIKDKIEAGCARLDSQIEHKEGQLVELNGKVAQARATLESLHNSIEQVKQRVEGLIS